MSDTYKFENGHLYVLRKGALGDSSWIHVFADARIKTKAAAIKVYESKELCGCN